MFIAGRPRNSAGPVSDTRRIANRPSGPSGERRVGNALGIVRGV
jgi:hypothetical protein